MRNSALKKTDENVVYMRIGMALVSTQRVEHAAKRLLGYLVEFKEPFQGLNSQEFRDKSPALDKLKRITLGNTLRLLNLNPKLSIDNEFKNYTELRNKFVHNLLENYLTDKSEKTKKKIFDFCFEVGEASMKMERFFKGFAYFLALAIVKERSELESDSDMNNWSDNLEYFIESLKHNELQ